MLISPADFAPQTDIQALIARHRPNGPLEREFYLSPAVHALDLERVWGRWWLFAGHSCTIPEPGDWFTYQVGGDSVIVVRGPDGKARGFHNTCRHRGSRICREERGHAPRLVCPYHRWTYELDGRLMTATRRDFETDPGELGLHPVALREVAGLIFVSLADDPPDFEEAFATIERKLAPHGLARAKVAHQGDYIVKANWKLVFENNRECYHCPANHPEYNVSTYDVLRDQARGDATKTKKIEAVIARANARFAALGLDTGDASSVMTGANWRCHRTPLMEGFATQSLDGKLLAPLMGSFKEPDCGTLRITIFPNFWQHANCDHAVAARLTPLSATETHVRGWWLVDRDAVEGRDYTLDRLLPVWDMTNRQDWRICEDQQAGVASSRYVPGPYSRSREYNVAHFIEWYLRQVAH